MGAQDQDAETARARLRLLAAGLATPARIQSGRRRSTPTARAPMDLGILDHVIKSVREITAHTRTAAPNAEPPPAAAADIYEWMIEATPHLDVERKMIRDAMIYRQGLEHALEMNDEDVVGWEPCPSCACWGLFWQSDHQKAMCANRRCTDRLGQPSMWTLQQLARHHVARKYADRKTAT